MNQFYLTLINHDLFLLSVYTYDHLLQSQLIYFNRIKRLVGFGLQARLSSIYSKQGMQSVRRLEALVFARMSQFQRGSMQSQLAFVASQIAKLIFNDAFIIIIFIFPLKSITKMVEQFFNFTQSINLVLTFLLAFFLVTFLLVAASQCFFLQLKLKSLVKLLVPWLDIFAMLIITISMQLLLVNIRESMALIPLNILSIISISVVQIFYNLFNFTKEPKSNNLFQVREAQIVTFCNIVQLMLTYYLAYNFFINGHFQKSEVIVIGLVQFGVSLIKIKQRIFLQYYLSPFSQNVSSLFYFVELYLSMLVSVNYLFGIELLSTNLLFILIIMTLLSYSALNSYLSRRNSCIILSSAADLKEEDQAILYLDRLCELINKVQREEEDTIFVSLKKKHNLTCKSPQCYCQRSYFTLCDFVREYVRCEVAQITEIFHNSPSILISILYFKMVVYKYYPEMLAKLNYYSSHFNLSLTQRYYKYCLIQYVTKFIRKRNYEIQAVNAQHMFKLEELRTELENIITGEVQVRSKKWKYLSRGLCRVSELEHTCNASLRYISRIMQIFEENKTVFKKSKEFNLLFLFYFTKVSFLNNGKDIRQNLKELYYGYKEDQLYNLRQFQKFIYHKRSCVIQTIIDTKIMGIVTAASRNVEDMFGFPINKIVGISINNLMPQFMAIEHEDILADWAKSGTWRTIGKLKEIYCVHKEQYCFSALLYLKIYIKDNTMHFITNIFKLNENDYLVINPNMKIEGLGRKFLKLLGESAKRMNLELLIEHNNSLLSHQTYAEGKTHRKIFLSLRNLQSQVDLYLQNINMKFDEKQRSQINSDFHEKIKRICQQKYYVQFTIKRYRMGKLGFVVIGLKQAKRVDRQQSIKYLQRHATFLQTKSNDLIDYSAVSSQESDFERDDDNQELLIQHNANSSLTSMSEKQNYPLSKTIEKFIYFVQDPSTIKDARLSRFNLIMVVILLLLSILNFISYYCSNQLLREIEMMFFADGAQNDVMQSTEIGYNFIYVLRSQLTSNASFVEFNSTLASARLVNGYVYALRQNDFSRIVTSSTRFTNERLYSYLSKPVTWILNKKPMVVLTHQFLQNMYYLITRIVNNLQGRLKSNATSINTTYFSELFNNFPQMQLTNEFYLEQYQRISNQQHDILNLFTIGFMVLYFLLSLTLAITLNRYFRFRFDQLIHSFNFFSYVPGQFLEKMRDYYSSLLAVVLQKDRLKAIDLNEEAVFQMDTYDLFRKEGIFRSSLSSKVKFINYENYYKWIFIFLIFCLVNFINYLATSHIRNFFPTSRTVIQQITSLMRSENQLLETYFTLRAAYSLNATISIKAYEELITALNQTTANFNNFANQITTMFSQYDPDFQSKYIESLVMNVCHLSAPFLTSFENDKCLTQLPLNVLDGGILISMNFFQRNLLVALDELRSQVVMGNATSSLDYFRQGNYVELDKMLIYMFKVFQQGQNITFSSYSRAIEEISTDYLNITIGMTVLFLVVLGGWLKSIPSQKENLAYLYGHLVLIPFMILKSNTRIAGSLKEAIQYSDN